MFNLFPAIDIRGGQCVRLTKGDYSQETVYSADPLEVAAKWTQAGASWLHCIDLDGAREGRPVNTAVIRSIVQAFPGKVQVGGGIRTEDAVKEWLDAGVVRVILGTVALKDRDLLEDLVDAYKAHIVVSLDSKSGEVAGEGWLQGSGLSIDSVAVAMNALGVCTLIVTDIQRDGTLGGINLDLSLRVARASGLPVIVAGGVANLDDIHTVKAHEKEGLAGVVIGKALYEGTVDLAEAIKIGGELGSRNA